MWNCWVLFMDLLKHFDGSKDQSGKILLYKVFAGIGDLLWRTALFRELKKRNPKMKLIVSGHLGDFWKLIYQKNPHIDELRSCVAGLELNLDDVDEYIEDRICMHVVTDYSKKLHAIDVLGKWAGFEIYDKSYWYENTEKEKQWAIQFLNKKTQGPVIGIGLKASTWVRTWTPLEIKRLIKLLLSKNYKIIILDALPTDLKDLNITSMSGGYTIREVAAVIEQLDLLITPDTGFLHFGGHFKTPTLAIFGGTSPELRTKYYDTVTPILGKNKLSCWPCYLHAPNCPHGIPSPCISQITAEQVFKEVGKI